MSSLNETTILWLLYSCSNRKDVDVLQRIPQYSLHYLRGRYAFKAKYARALFCCGLYDTGMEYMKLFEKDEFRFSDCNNILLDGLYLGGYYKQCIEMFDKLKELSLHPKDADTKPPELYNVGYGAVLKSYCKLKDEEGMNRIMSEMSQKGVIPREDAYYEMCELFDHSEKWKAKAERVFEVCQQKGVLLSETQKQMISARAREECFGAGVIVINDYCKKYDSVLDIHKEAKEFGICVFQKS